MLITHSVDVLTRRDILDNLKVFGRRRDGYQLFVAIFSGRGMPATPKNLVAIEAHVLNFTPGYWPLYRGYFHILNFADDIGSSKLIEHYDFGIWEIIFN